MKQHDLSQYTEKFTQWEFHLPDDILIAEHQLRLQTLMLYRANPNEDPRVNYQIENRLWDDVISTDAAIYWRWGGQSALSRINRVLISMIEAEFGIEDVLTRRIET